MKISSTALKLVTTAVFGIRVEVVHGHGVSTLLQNATVTSPPRSLRRRKPLASRDMAANTNDPSFDKREQNASAITTATSRHLQNVWEKLGEDIDGEAEGDYSGEQVALSNDGTIVAIGAYRNDANGIWSGHVRVFQLVEGSWNPMGGDIDGEAAGDWSGYGLDLSADGSIVAIGAPNNDSYSGHVRIYKYDGSSWKKLGGDLDGEGQADVSGTSVSLSADGSIVAIGAIGAKSNDGNGYRSGDVRIYKYDGSSWIKLGGDLEGEGQGDLFGRSVSLSADGSIVAIGAIRNGGVNGPNSGHVRIYKFDGTSSWDQVGGDLDGEAANDNSGVSIDLSSDGSIVAIGAPRNDANVEILESGHVRIYKYDGTSWNQAGGDLDGEVAGDGFGASIDLSDDGFTVAIGARGSGSCSGHVRIYKYNGTSWNKVGRDLEGEAIGDQFGASVALSSDGSIVAIGGLNTDGVNGVNSGHVRVFGQTKSGKTNKSTKSGKMNKRTKSRKGSQNTNAMSHVLNEPVKHQTAPHPFPIFNRL